MKNILSLLIFFQTFLIFGQANTHDGLSERSSASEKVSSPSFFKRKMYQKRKISDYPMTGQQPAQEPKMTCSVSRNVRQTGLASDCYCAIAFLYDPSYPACAICRTCVVQPLDGDEVPYGGRTDQNGQPKQPSITLARMNAAYDAVFQAHVYTDAPICDNYVLPAGVELDPNYVPKSKYIYPTFLLGQQSGQGEKPMACNASLADQAYKEAM